MTLPGLAFLIGALPVSLGIGLALSRAYRRLSGKADKDFKTLLVLSWPRPPAVLLFVPPMLLLSRLFGAGGKDD